MDRHDVVVVGDDDRRWHGDVADPSPRVEPPDRPPGLDDLVPVVAGDLVEPPPRRATAVAPAVPAGEGGVGQLGDRHGAGDDTRTGGDAEEQPLAHRAGERGARRAQHEAVDELAMALPDELGDRPAHRVADRHEAVDAQLASEGGDVVGAVLEAERLDRAQAAAVAAVIDGDDAEVLGERVEAGEPVEVSGRCPAVQQHQHRRARRAGQLADERPAPARKPHVAAGWEPRRCVWLSALPRPSESPPGPSRAAPRRR